MNVRLLLLMVWFFCSLSAVAAEGDTLVPYKVGKYDIKKTEKVYVTAQKLHVDPELIVKLNKLRNIQQDLVPGQRIKIPVYPKGYKYEQPRIVIHKEINADSAQLALLYSDVENNFLAPLPEKYFDPEEDRTRLMMLEAQLELNEAMLQGVQASFDSLNLEDNSPVDEKNVQAMLRKMKRSREKALLTPYLENVRDSLTKELTKISEEKKVIETRINPPAAPIVTHDTIINASDTVIYATKTYADNRPAEKTVAEVRIRDDEPKEASTVKSLKRTEKKTRKPTVYYAIDTVIVYDLPSTTAKLVPSPERGKIKQPEHVKGNWDTARAIDPLLPKGQYWDTAHAVSPAADTPKSTKTETATVIKKDTLVPIKIKVPGGTDSIVINPVVKKQEPKKQELLVKETNPEATKHSIDSIFAATKDTTTTATPEKKSQPQTAVDTTTPVVSVISPPVKSDTVKTIPQPAVPKKREGVGEAFIAAADSLRRIKAEFFYRRYQKSMNDKNFRNAEEYLNKAVELAPRYFDAWFALAEMHARFGSKQLALKEYQTCLEIDSTKPKLFLGLGTLQEKLKRKSDAYNSYNKALELNPNDISTLMARAAILTDWKKYRDAIIDYDRVLTLNRAAHYAYKARGQAKFMNKDYQSAIDDFTRFLIFEETDPSAYYYRGLAKISNNELIDGCMDLSNANEMGYPAAGRAIKKSCE